MRIAGSLTLLLTIGVAAALAYSIWSLLAGQGHVYFEVACMILVASTLGRWLEATGKLKTTEALRGLSRLLPEQVRRLAGLARDLRVVLPRGQARPVGHLAKRRYRRLLGLRRRLAHAAGVRRRDPDAAAGRGCTRAER